MPNLPDIPGKSLIGGTTNRARVVAAAGAGAALAVGGVVAKRVLGHGGSKDEGAKDDGLPVAADLAGTEADATVVPIVKEKAPPTPPKPKPAKPKAAKPKAAPKPKPKPDVKAAPTPKPKPKPAKPKAVDEKPKPAKPKPVDEKPKTVKPKAAEEKPKPVDPDGGPPSRQEDLDQ